MRIPFPYTQVETLLTDLRVAQKVKSWRRLGFAVGVEG